jgi:SAM-dependent methyltransferase
MSRQYRQRPTKFWILSRILGISAIYQRAVLPRLIDASMRLEPLTRLRRECIPDAIGVVLDAGIGSGLNLPFYGPAVTRIIGIDTSSELLVRARARGAGHAVPVGLVRATAGQLPLRSASVDTVVMTWVLCSFPSPLATLRELHRVLKPSGRLVFIEHGLSSDGRVRTWQNRLTPLWRPLAGGCHLNRPVASLLRHAGFSIVAMRTGYVPGPRPLTYMYSGIAHP